MNAIQIASAVQAPMARQPMEYVERKGTGHPDTMCDSMMEAIAVGLSAAYLEQAGRILHFNVDKGLLVAGESEPKLGGGRILAPMKLIVGDRATDTIDGKKIPVAEICEASAASWIRSHLRYVDPSEHLVIQNELRKGSSELTGIFRREKILANDTSMGIGYAPLSETENLVLAIEHHLNSPSFKREFPETGEDIKVMGIRRDRTVELTIAIAMVDQFILSEKSYVQRKRSIEEALNQYLESEREHLDAIHLAINALDDPSRGMEGMYLTVLGTSAESADGGQVGRGNRVNGLITLSRPMTLEAAAGKNPVSHVGKVYNLLARQIAERIYHAADPIEEVYVWLCSRIGQPLDQPWSSSIQLALTEDACPADFEDLVADIVSQELAVVDQFTEKLARGELPVC